jgi:hypothetical protein
MYRACFVRLRVPSAGDSDARRDCRPSIQARPAVGCALAGFVREARLEPGALEAESPTEALGHGSPLIGPISGARHPEEAEAPVEHQGEPGQDQQDGDEQNERRQPHHDCTSSGQAPHRMRQDTVANPWRFSSCQDACQASVFPRPAGKALDGIGLRPAAGDFVAGGRCGDSDSLREIVQHPAGTGPPSKLGAGAWR